MGLTITLAISRAVIIFLLSQFHVTRLDTPFVHPGGVGYYLNGYLDLEPYYKWFLTAVLLVESHRHPYIETLGTMYLMKLKHTSFNNRIGIKWRMIFVKALMPWLEKYRVYDVVNKKES